MIPDYPSYTEDELLEAFENIDKEAWPERYIEIKKHLQKFADEAKEKPLVQTDNIEDSESSWWRKIDFNKPKEKLITFGLTIWTLYILFTGQISAKNSQISFEDSPKTYIFFISFCLAILVWRIHGHLTSHNKNLKRDC